MTDRPAYLSPRLLALVAAGGVAGTAAREGVALALPATGVLPTLAVNLAGGFLLGLLLESLLLAGPDAGARRRLRLVAGTGFLGGFTTYSSLATESATLLHGHAAASVVYAVGTLAGGALACWAGLGVAIALRRRAADG